MGGQKENRPCEVTGRGARPQRAFLVTVVALAFITLTVKAVLNRGLERMRVLTRLFLDFVEKRAKADKNENMIKTKSR